MKKKNWMTLFKLSKTENDYFWDGIKPKRKRRIRITKAMSPKVSREYINLNKEDV